MIGTGLACALALSANAEPRRGGRAVDMLVLHYTGMESAAAARERLCSDQSGVSCHYLVDEDGAITQMVSEDLRAWHAGQSFWRGETDSNSRSIGIEIHNPGHALGYRDFPEAQMRAVTALCLDIMARHAIPPRNVLAHSDVAPGRKIDPGERFDWRGLHGEGVGHWVEPEPCGDMTPLGTEALAELQHLLGAYGYAIAATGLHDAQTARVTDAFHRHFRPERIGPVADRSTLLTARRLVAALPA